MNNFKILRIASLFIVLNADSLLCYPSTYYGGRYSRSTPRASYDDDFYQKNHQYPYAYVPSYAQLYPDDYYYNGQSSYPMYYITPRAPKHNFYKANLPYYYQDMPISKVQSKYNYYNYPDSSYDEQERLLQEIEREQRERSQPIGHEIRYENDYNIEDDDNGVDETNAAFLNNLMLQQIYQEKSPSYYDQYPYVDYSNDESDSINLPVKWDDVPYDRPVNIEDEEVKELKDLSNKQRKTKQRKQRKQRIKNNDFNNSPLKRSEDNMVFTDRKPVANSESTTSTEGPRIDTRGQKEEVLMRPATPVRHPFSSSVLDMISQQEQRKRSPSVYDTIRQMLEMDKKKEEEHQDPKSDIGQTKKKRIVSNEDTLTKQLSVLKKAQ